jgi:hypothetical protein
MQMETAMAAALANIAQHGDTDIFPFPFENLIFRDEPLNAQASLEAIHQNFVSSLANSPPQTIPTLAQVGYAGFRWATLIDPLWNAYYLALLVSIADQIETQRIPEADQRVFSYRFDWQPSSAKLFKDSTWITFRQRCVELSKANQIVVQTDIADFYPRIYHHRIENALHRLPSPGDTPSRIMELLGKFAFSKHVSYGIPIGGPGSRILAELALDGVDKLLIRSGINFCRYADDYAIFCKDKSEAYRALVFLSEKLANEGLSLQKKKTRILSSDEFLDTIGMLAPTVLDDNRATDEQRLLNISVRFDPYSPHAEQEYEELKLAVSNIDVVGIIGRELAKTSIDTAVAKQAVQAIAVLTPKQQELAARTLLAERNLLTLAPVFVTVIRVVRDLYPQFSIPFRKEVDNLLCDLLSNNSPLLSVEVNLAYFLQALAGNQTERKEELLIKLFRDSANPIIRRLIILTMARWGCTYWLSDIKNQYAALTAFEKRAFLVASYALGDEGKHWRQHTKPTWDPQAVLVRNWYSNRYQTNKSVPV